ncbi:MAG: ABC transporter permease [Phycisphaerales bacterium]
MTDTADTLDARSVQHAAPAASGGATDRHEYVIDQSRGSVWARFREAFSRRGLLLMLIQRDIKVRYRQAVLGIAWAILIPTLSLVIYWVVFGVLGRLGPDYPPYDHLPYVMFLFPAMLGYNYFSSSVGRASNSLKTDTTLLSKIYFPRLLLPLSNIISPLIDFALGCIVLMVILLWFRHAPPAQVVLVVPALLLAGVAACGLGMGLAALNAYFRDVQHALPVILQMWFFCSPVLYSADRVPESYRTLYAINPMVTVCESIRFAVIGGTTPLTVPMVLTSVLVAVVMLVVGVAAFMRLEQTVTDVL